MGLPQQTTEPSPALVHRACVPQVEHSYRFPSWFATSASAYLGWTGWSQQVMPPVPPLVTMNSEPHLAQR